ncbi:MAG TPA: hypothetical protein DCO77_09880, partial [Nitrospiraceae bacterium]|nr:hypothetical protein [Nitrospiraceae bacterium]
KLSECRDAGVALEKDKEQYRTIVETQTEFIVRCKADGTRTFVNEAYLRHFGLTREQAIGSSFLPLVAEDDRQSIFEKIERLTPENPIETDEHRVIRPDNSIGWQQWVDRAFFDAKGNIIEIQSVGRDITDRRVAEEALAESENRYKDLFSSIRDVIIIADEERTIIDANQPALRELFGYEGEDIIGKNTRILYADDEGYQGTGKEVFNKHKAVKGRLIEVDFRKKNGEVFRGEVYAFKLLDSEGKPKGNVGIIRDITGHRQTEDALRESERRYKDLFEGAPDAIFLADPETGVILDANSAASRLLGKPREDIVGLHQSALHPPEKTDYSKESFQEHIEAGQKKGQTDPIENEVVHADGMHIPVEVLAETVSLKGKPVIQGVFRDITERKKTEEALKESEGKFRSLAEESLVGIYLLQDGLIQYANPKLAAIFGYTVEEMTGKKISDGFIFQEDMPMVEENIFKRISGEEKSIHYSFRGITKKNSLIYLEAYGSETVYQGRPAIIGALIDITEHKQAEDALQKSEEKYRSLISNIPDVAWTTDWQGNTIFISPNVVNIYGYTSEEICQGGDDLWFGRIHPDDLEKVKKAFHELFEMGLVLDVEYRIQRKDGQWIWLRDRSIGTYEKEGVKLADGIFTDVTAKKEAERALRLTQYSIDHSADAAFWADAGARIIYVNEAACRSLGYSREELCAMTVHDFDADFPKETWPLQLKEMREHRSMTFESRHRSRDGGIFPVEITINMQEFEGREYIFGFVRDITDWKQSETKLSASEDQYRGLFNNATDGFAILSLEGAIAEVNPAFCRMHGHTREEVFVLSPLHIIHPDDRHKLGEGLDEIKAGRPFYTEGKHVRKDGGVFDVEVHGSQIIYEEEPHAFIVVRDITERKQADEDKLTLEAQLRHAQKMEAVGQLAGGVAHDFNNFLTGIVGYANILLMKLPEDAALKSYVDNILAASDRAANLTHSLLAFSRKQIMQPRPVELNKVVGDVGKLLRRIIGEDIDLKIQAGTQDIVVMADRNQVEQALLNLATNARDAMPAGGILTIETGRAEVDSDFIALRGYGEPGAYAVLSVNDTGVGMDRETTEKIFEPFFTTKDVGKGTGLGLAMVYGIIRQHNGHITVSSEPGKGTTFTLYLPLAVREADIVQPEKQLRSATGGSETILVAEDDENVRKLTTEILTQFGYTVIVAEDGDDAVRKFAENKERVQLLLLDVIMPKKNGRDVYEEARRVKPDIKALFLSGYTGDMLNSKKILKEGLHFAFKPVSPMDLLKKLREVLDA